MAKKISKKIIGNKSIIMNIISFDDGTLEKRIDVKNMNLAELLGHLEVARLNTIDEIKKSDKD